MRTGAGRSLSQGHLRVHGDFRGVHAHGTPKATAPSALRRRHLDGGEQGQRQRTAGRRALSFTNAAVSAPLRNLLSTRSYILETSEVEMGNFPQGASCVLPWSTHVHVCPVCVHAYATWVAVDVHLRHRRRHAAVTTHTCASSVEQCPRAAALPRPGASRLDLAD